MQNITRVNIIENRLKEAFSPDFLQVIDESDQHAGHAGHGGGGRHFAIIISSPVLTSLSRVEAHRKIYALFSDLMPHKIHALRIVIR